MNISKITTITQPSFTGVKIISKDNKQCKYLYNKVSDIVTTNKIPATFTTEHIELPRTNENILNQLKQLGIKFIQEVKKGV